MKENKFLQSKLTWIIILTIVLTLVFIVFVIANQYDSKKNKNTEKEHISISSSSPKATADTSKVTSKKPAIKDDVLKKPIEDDKKPTTITPSTKAPATKDPATKKPTTRAPDTKEPTKAPTKKPTKAPTKKPAKTEAPTKKPTVKPVTGETNGVSNTEINQYFSESVFIGDSVMYGFQLYCMRQEKGYLGNPDFLVAESFSARWAMLPVTNKSVHPKYQGVKRSIWESIGMIKPKRVFFFFGLNDLGGGLTNGYSNYLSVLKKMETDYPDIEINIVSTTPMYKGSEKKNLNNKNINGLNNKTKKYCELNGHYYFDIATHLKDEEGFLAKNYCSDRYVHQTNSAYKVWEAQLKKYAAARINQMKAAKATKAPKATK